MLFTIQKIGKTIVAFRRTKFWLPQNSLLSAKSKSAGRVSSIKLSLLALDEFYTEK